MDVVQSDVKAAVEETIHLRESRISEEKKTMLMPGIFELSRNYTVLKIMKQVITIFNSIFTLRLIIFHNLYLSLSTFLL